MSSTTLALAASPSSVRSRIGWRVLLAFAGSWLVAALARFEIELPFAPVPITGQTLGVLLVGASLGAGLGGSRCCCTSRRARSVSRSTPAATLAWSSSASPR